MSKPCKDCKKQVDRKGARCASCQSKYRARIAAGVKNKPCVKCGAVDRNSSGGCRPCSSERAKEKYYQDEKHREAQREYSKLYYEQNKESRLEYSREYHKNNPEKSYEKSKRWKKANPEKQREGIKKWKQNNPEKIREQGRRAYWRDPEKHNERVSQWRKENPENGRAYNHVRRARKRQNGGSFTVDEWKALCEQYGNKCCYPGCDRTDLHMDHVIPLSRGGSNDISNIQPLCAYHNMSKGTKKTDYRTKPGLKRWVQKTIFGF